MCGIHGITWPDKPNITKMVRLSETRGPDGEGYYLDKEVAFGHNLLSITDSPELSQQPYKVNDSHVLCYNGEIYNYKELKKQIEKRHKHKFRTNCDTEVLAYGLFFEGVEFIKKIDGMYALSWYDKKNLTITLARDSAGAKPIYYSHSKGENFCFSSSIKSLLSLGLKRNLDLRAFYFYKSFGYVAGPDTLINSIKKLVPGEVITYTHRKRRRVFREFVVSPNLKSEPSIFEPKIFRDSISSSVKKCLMGNREIGLFLSGGLDSAMILHEMSSYLTNVKSFTTRFECSTKHNRYNNDADIAYRLSKQYGTNHTDFLITFENFLDAIEPCVEALEEPRYNRNTPAYYLLNKELSRQGITVTLSGDGGDEIFSGYKPHKRVRREPLKNIVKGKEIYKWQCSWSFKQNTPTMISPTLQDLNINDIRLRKDMMDWIPDNCFGEDALNNLLFIETITHLPEDYLIRNDKLGMNFSMEARFPLTLKSLREYILTIPLADKMKTPDKRINTPFENDQETEMKMLPKLAYQGYLPDYVIEKKKTGWSIPTEDWLESDKFKGEFLNPVLSKGYHEGTDMLFDFDKIEWMKPQINIFYFRIWAKKFGITL